MTGPRHRHHLVMIGALCLSAALAACSGDDGAGENAADGVQTVDAAAAAASRAELTAGNTNDDDTNDDDTAGEPSADAESAGGSGSSIPSTTAAPTTASTASTAPVITEEISPPDPGVRALLSPTGVLVQVTGQTPSGFVVETPCGVQTLVEAGQTIGGVDVVLDPGHGGDEQGAEDVPELTEASLNLLLARATAAELRARSISVVLTRNADYRIPIRARAELADRIAPRAFVSIHHNTPASRPSPEPGTEVFVQSASPESKRLGGLLYEEVFNALRQFDVQWTSRDDAGVLVVLNDEDEDAYGIARYPLSTSALVEMAYLGNEFEAALLATDDYLDVGAKALADGIERFLNTEDPGTGFVDTPRRFNPSGATGGSTGCVDPPLD
ncbi:MAG: N-acetylmuramoyl-L-alanine amidase family protein [Acidimicrobiales bacterium]